MSDLIVTGYASLDYSVALAGPIRLDETTRISHRDPAAWPRVGGSPYYVASAARQAGMNAAPVTWTGDDAPAKLFRDACEQSGLPVSGINALPGRRSPVCLLLHQEDESTACLFDPAFPGEEHLSPAQLELLETCSHACITVGPGHLIGPVLEHLPASATLYFAAKNDQAAFPDAAMPTLLARASVVFCNRAERDWINQHLKGNPIFVETRGAEGCRVHYKDGEHIVPADPVETRDPTGAGDMFVGAFIAAHSQGAGPVEAAKAATKLARDMLERRTANG